MTTTTTGIAATTPDRQAEDRVDAASRQPLRRRPARFTPHTRATTTPGSQPRATSCIRPSSSTSRLLPRSSPDLG